MASAVRGVGASTGGVMLVVIGLAFTLERLTGGSGLWRWLPLLVIYLAGRDLREPRPDRPPSIVPLLASVWLQVVAIGFLGFDLLNGWPLLVVLAGIGLVVDGLVRGARASGASEKAGDDAAT
jgi:hypothetical protein